MMENVVATVSSLLVDLYAGHQNRNVIRLKCAPDNLRIVQRINMYQMGHPVRVTLDIAMLGHVPQEMTSAKITMDHVCMRGREGTFPSYMYYMHSCSW